MKQEEEEEGEEPAGEEPAGEEPAGEDDIKYEDLRSQLASLPSATRRPRRGAADRGAGHDLQA